MKIIKLGKKLNNTLTKNRLQICQESVIKKNTQYLIESYIEVDSELLFRVIRRTSLFHKYER